jgi:hypothetical protein
MKCIGKFVFVAIALLGFPLHAQQSDYVARAQEATTMWLGLTDAGEYSRSWEQAAGYFQSKVTKAAWESAVRAARSPLGSVNSRKLKSAVFTRTIPGAPDGEYVVIQYDTTFEHNANAKETVTPLREKDGTWKVSGYFIK